MMIHSMKIPRLPQLNSTSVMLLKVSRNLTDEHTPLISPTSNSHSATFSSSLPAQAFHLSSSTSSLSSEASANPYNHSVSTPWDSSILPLNLKSPSNSSSSLSSGSPSLHSSSSSPSLTPASSPSPDSQTSNPTSAPNASPLSFPLSPFSAWVKQHKKQPRRRIKSESVYPETISKLLKPSAQLVMAASGIQHREEDPGEDLTTPSGSTRMSLQEAQELRDMLRTELTRHVGQHRSEKLYRHHAQRHHFLLVYTEGDQRVGEQIQRELMEAGGEHQVTTLGPQSVHLGELICEAWGRFSATCQQAVVLVSRELFQNTKLQHWLMEMDDLPITPLFLQNFTTEDFPPSLAPLRLRNGSSILDDHWNIRDFVSGLLAHYNFKQHLIQEVDNLMQLVGQVTRNEPCPCGDC